MSEYEAEEVEDAVRACVKEFETFCIANRVIETNCIYCEREPNETAYCNKWHKYLDHGCECEEVALKDVVEVVRCKDCKFWTKDENVLNRGICDEWSDYEDSISRYTGRDDYCSYGERKEE